VSCGANSRRVALSTLKCGISRLSSQAASYIQTPRGRSQLAGASRLAVISLGLTAVVASAARLRPRTRGREKPEYDRGEAEEQAVVAMRRAGGALYDRRRFDWEAGIELSDMFGGAFIAKSSLLRAVGERGQLGSARPLAKLGGDDDVFAAEGARGHVAFTMPDGPEGPVRLEAVMPARGQEAALRGALDGRLPKYVVVDPETDDRYATRNPYEARQFAKALRLDPGEDVFEALPGDDEFDEAYKPVPEAIFY
jgi:hypothetical protein